jgi:peroxiredoxin
MESVGGSAKDFTLTDIYGSTKSLSSYHDKVVLLTFWTTWCPTCRKQMGSIQRVNDMYRYKNFAVVTVNMDDDDSNITAYMAQNGYSFTALYDRVKSVGRMYGVRAFPTSFIIDSNGNIVDRIVGGVDWTRGKYAEDLLKLMGTK